MQICNACRYCEGFCAVFPAMTRRLEFGKADVHYLANLCHNCGACLHACQYAPPHEFAVNVPQAMAQVRGADLCATTPGRRALGALYRRNGLTLSPGAGRWAGAVPGAGAGAARARCWHAPLAGNFYAVFPHNLLVALFGAGVPVRGARAGAWACAVSGATSRRPPAARRRARPRPRRPRDALRLKYLDGGHGEGCNDDGRPLHAARRRFHHLTFYGFMLCFAATCVATLYHYVLGWPAPYGCTSLPKLLGTVGGVGLLVGTGRPVVAATCGAIPLHGDPAQRPMDLGFIALLFLTSAHRPGAAGLARHRRDGPAAGLHLGAVMALFLTLPYGKFAHGIYRGAALLKYAVEKRQPNPIGLGAD